MLDHFGAEIADALIVELGLVLRCGRPEISSAQRARHSSIGSTKPKRAMPRLSPSALFNASPSARPCVLYGVVIVDIQVAFDVDLHAEAAVGGDLIQHVVEEADAGFDFAAFAIQPDVDIDLRLFGHAVNPRMTIAQGQLAHDLSSSARRAGSAAPECPCFPPAARRSADRRSRSCGRYQHAGFEITLHQRGLRLAAVAVVRRQVRADQHIGELNALRAEICIIRLCGGSKVSAGKLAVPSPS